MKPKKQKLHVITPYFNPVRFKSRDKLTDQFINHMLHSDAVELHLVECAFGKRNWRIPESDDYNTVRLRTKEELWLKENMINIAISRLPHDWEYVAWIDGDIHFLRDDWAEETIQQLQHFHIIQLWSEALDLDPQYQVMQKHKSFCYVYNQKQLGKAGPYDYAHPGYAWAATRFAVDSFGGLLDTPILGSADYQMAWAMVGKAETAVPPRCHPNYKKAAVQWGIRAEKKIRRNIGYVEGSIAHYWHGRKAQRYYVEREKIIVKEQFDPETDLVRDSQGLWQLTDKNTELRDMVRHYFRSRNEDGTDL